MIIISHFFTTDPYAHLLFTDPSPAQFAASTDILYETIDDLCYLCYDTNVNHNSTSASSSGVRTDWYIRRAFIFSFYTSSELFLLTDTTTDLSDTKYGIIYNYY